MSVNHIVSLEKFKSNPKKFIRELHKTRMPFVLTQDNEAVAVIQDMGDYRKLMNAVYMFKIIAQGEKEIMDFKGIDQSKVFEEIDKILETTFE